MTIGNALDLLARCDGAASPAAYGAAYLDALRPLGAKSLWARSFRLTRDWVDPAVSGLYRTRDHVKLREPAWFGSEAQKFSDMLCPLAQGAAQFQRPFFASQVAPHDAPEHAPYWEAMAEFDVRDTLAVPHFGPNHMATALTIWFTHAELSPAETDAIRLSSLIAMERLREPASVASIPPLLSIRERDCLSYVADGMSDGEIAARLGISAHTAHAHVENAKRKLDARTRAQAVAKAFALGELLLP